MDLDSASCRFTSRSAIVVEAIASGALVKGSALPSTRQLAADLVTNFHTANKAHDLLRQQGTIRIGCSCVS
jgi:DNA-binding transcriptional regulator YhcF (GntR family)